MTAPRASRPAFRGYDTTLPWSWADERLHAARNFWHATTSVDRGPYARPIWGLWCEGLLLFTSSPRSRKARDFLADPRVSVHAELVEAVVALEGVVEEVAPTDGELDAYARRYGWRPPESQRWFVVRPRRAYAAVEETYPEAATVFDF